MTYRHILHAVFLLQFGCGYYSCFNRPESPEPCEFDPLGCDASEELEIASDCALDDPLMVRVGTGESDFEPLAEGDSIEAHSGGQGGEHYFLGVAIDNPSLDATGLEVDFSVRVAASCPVDAEECNEWLDFAERNLIVTDPELLTVADDMLETSGYVVVLRDEPEFWGLHNAPGHEVRVDVTADVRDACDRTGIATHSFTFTADDPSG